MNNRIVSRQEWLKARLELLEEEKALTRQRDALSKKRRELPLVEIDGSLYRFDGPDGPQNFMELFGDKRQLLIYHFMFGADWNEGCPSCSFWADSFNGLDLHFAHRDMSFVVVSSAPYAKLDGYRRRMGWSFKWVSSEGCSFNRDFQVSFQPEELEGLVDYNYRKQPFPSAEAPGASTFYLNEEGKILHKYSCYARGLDALNAAYQWMDLSPKGRDEDDLDWPMAWLRRRDQYSKAHSS